jgi:hypothetical protein
LFFFYFAHQYKYCMKIFSWSTLAGVLKKCSPGPKNVVGGPECIDCIIVLISYNHMWTCFNNLNIHHSEDRASWYILIIKTNKMH